MCISGSRVIHWSHLHIMLHYLQYRKLMISHLIIFIILSMTVFSYQSRLIFVSYTVTHLVKMFGILLCVMKTLICILDLCTQITPIGHALLSFPVYFIRLCRLLLLFCLHLLLCFTWPQWKKLSMLSFIMLRCS